MSESELLNNVLQARAGGAVQRAHTIRHIGSYSVAEHSWGVAMLLLQIYPSEFKRLAPYALVHDIPEGLTGDIPSTAKAGDTALDSAILSAFNLPDPADLGSAGHEVLKSCDRLDLYLWAREQLEAGNSFAKEIVDNLESRFNLSQEESGLEVRAWDFYNYLQHSQLSVVPQRSHLLRTIKESYDL